MVDFQERDTTRGLSGDDGSRENGEGADDGEAELDEVRQQLEERPSEADDQEGDDEATDAAAEDEDADGAEHDHGDADEAGDSGDEAGGPEDEAEEEAGGPEDEAEEEAGGPEDEAEEEAGEPAAEADDDEPAEQDHGGATDHEHDHAAGHDHGGGHHAADREQLGAAVVTVSSSRTMDDDPSGDYLVSSLVDAGHDVVTRELIADDYDGVQHTVDTLVRRSDVDVVVTTGGTGVTPDDRTIEAVRPLFEKELPGFGELFRRRSVEAIGARVVATRATAGVADGVPVFCLPGSTSAVRLGVDEIIVDVAPHLAGLADPHDGHDHGGGAGHEHGHSGHEHDHAHDDDHEHPVE